jgi:hypothetical protein
MVMMMISAVAFDATWHMTDPQDTRKTDSEKKAKHDKKLRNVAIFAGASTPAQTQA